MGLVLTRRVGERILVGKDVVVEIIDVQQGRVRVRIEAPRDVPIRRGEIQPFPQPPREVPA